jgi:hypothetical protein
MVYPGESINQKLFDQVGIGRIISDVELYQMWVLGFGVSYPFCDYPLTLPLPLTLT